MVGIDDVLPRVPKHVEILRVTVAFKKDDVVRVHGSDGFVEPPVYRHDGLFGGVRGLVYGVVAGDPWVVLVALGDGLPDVHNPVLKVLVLPKKSLVGRVVRVPVLVLESRKGMEVDDRVDLVSGAQFDGPVEVLEAILLDLQRPHVVLEVSVVER